MSSRPLKHTHALHLLLRGRLLLAPGSSFVYILFFILFHFAPSKSRKFVGVFIFLGVGLFILRWKRVCFFAILKMGEKCNKLFDVS
jgi:hypothetical protein